MRANLHQEDADALCARIAASQHGLIHRRQAIEAGLSASAIQRRCSNGAWFVQLPRVYVFRGSPVTWLQRVTAVALWAGDDAALGYFTAAALLGLLESPALPIHVVARRRLKAPRPEVSIHRASSLEPCDVALVSGVRTTTATRTVLDLAFELEDARLEVMVDDALRRGATSIPRLRWALEREGRRGRQGTAALRRLLAERGEKVPESALETHFLRLVRRAKLPVPVSQHEIREGGRVIGRVDFAYPARKLAIEVDGYRFHSGRAAWARDAGRSNRLVRLGWRILRFTWEDVLERPHEVARLVAAALWPVLGESFPT